MHLTKASTTKISHQENPNLMNELVNVALCGGNVAKTAKIELERNRGRSVISAAKASDYLE